MYLPPMSNGVFLLPMSIFFCCFMIGCEFLDMFLFCFLLCCLQDLCSPCSQASRCLNDRIYGIECIFFLESQRLCALIEMGLLDKTLPLEWDILPVKCHSEVTHPGWGSSFSKLLLLLSWFSPLFCWRTSSRCFLSKGAKEVDFLKTFMSENVFILAWPLTVWLALESWIENL